MAKRDRQSIAVSRAPWRTKTKRRDLDHTAEPDAALLARIAKGDRDALGTLFERHGSEVYRFARRVAPSQDADEIVQLVFMQIGAGAGRFDAPGRSARSWVFGIASRIMANHRRRYQRAREVLTALSHLRARDVVEPHHTLRRDIARALALLPDATREAFLLFEAHGFSGSEVAEMQDVPIGTVWRRLHDARAALRQCLEDQR